MRLDLAHLEAEAVPLGDHVGSGSPRSAGRARAPGRRCRHLASAGTGARALGARNEITSVCSSGARMLRAGKSAARRS